MKDTVISMGITLFVLSVLVMAGTDNTSNNPFYTSSDSHGYGYGYGYGYGDTTTNTGSGSSSTRGYTNTKTLYVKYVPANDGFDYDSIPRPNDTHKTNDTHKNNDTWFDYEYDYKDTGFINDTIVEDEPDKPFPSALIGGFGILMLLFAYYINKQMKKGKVDKK